MVRAVWAVLLVAACGDDGVHHLRDASPDSSEPGDGMVFDAPPAVGAVTVRVTFLGAPSEGSTVYFIDPDGTAQTVLTDTNGLATATVTEGASVTVIDPHVDFKAQRVAGTLDRFNGQVYTMLAVAPGDDLQIDTFPTSGADLFNFTVTVPPLTGASFFAINAAGCSGTSAPVGTTTVQMTGCSGATHDLLLTGFDDLGAVVGTIFLENQTLVEGGAVTFTAPYDLPATTTATLMHLPTDGDASVAKSLGTAHGPLFSSGGTGTITGGSLTATFPTIVNDGIAAYTESVQTDFPQGALDTGRIFQWGPASDTYVLDAAPLLLADFATAPLLDVPTQRVLWTEASGPGTATPDGILMELFINRDSAAGSSGWRWFVVGPGSEDGHVQLPTLPTDMFSFNPVDSDLVDVGELETATVTGGYRAYIKAHPWRDADIGLPALAAPGTSGTSVSTVLAL